MNAEIIAVGTELLLGQILNTNAQYLSVELSQLGIDVFYQTVVGDNQKRLEEALQNALDRTDIVILTGGLGPTKDDLTKETVAQIMGLSLVPHQESLDRIKSFFHKMHRVMTNNNEKQALLPEGSIVLLNDNGTAPGCIIEKNGKTIVMLPGPPKEMQPMFKQSVYPYLRNKSPYIIHSHVLRIFGIGESALEEQLADIFESQSNPTIAPYAKQGEVTLRITAKCEDVENAEKLIQPVEDEIRSRLGITVYGVEEESLEEVTCRLLMDKGVSVATAESCTGGLLSERFTSIPGISKCFHMGAITYSNDSKAELLGVSSHTLDRYGAVSSQTALEMADGIRKKSDADIGISVTGIAGPGGGSQEKPVGLVYIGISTPDKKWYKELHLTGNRERIRNMIVMNTLDIIRKHLLGHQK
ncbi:MAG: competence/damage-inducible protein A [Clostridia bacterium]